MRQADGAAPGRRGAFLGCTGYPKCRNALPVDDQGKPVPPVKVEVACTKCGGAMAVRRGRRGSFLGCTELSQVPRAPRPMPDELKEQLAEQTGAAAAAPGRRPEDRSPVEETCEQCGGPMLVRRSRRGFFLGCAQYPKCKGTRQPGEATLAKINEVVGALIVDRRPVPVRLERGRDPLTTSSAVSDSAVSAGRRPAEGHGVGGGVGAAVRDRDQDVADPALDARSPGPRRRP